MKLWLYLILFFEVHFTNCYNRTADPDYNYQYNLLSTLLSDYETRLKAPGHTTVDTYVSIYQLVDLVEKEQVIVLKLWINQVWIDRRLSWNPLDHGNLTHIFIPSQSIWMYESKLML